jgi:hypothetical protein
MSEEPTGSLSRRLIANVLWGVRESFFFIKVYSVWALVAWFAGAAVLYAKYGLSIIGVLLFYCTALPLAGAVVGLLRPLGRTLLGQMFIGAMAALPITFAGFTLVFTRAEWPQLLIPTAVGTAVVLGPLYGAINWIVTPRQ